MGTQQVEVLKFGGSSLGSIEAIGWTTSATEQHLAQDGVHVVVFTSAIEFATKQLHNATDAALDPQEDYRGILNSFGENHSRIIADLPNTSDASALSDHLGRQIEEITTMLEAIRIGGDASPGLKDYIVSAGERLSAPIVAAFLREQGVNAVSLAPEDVLATDGRFGDANPDILQTSKNIQENVLPHFSDGKVVIIGGYYGARRKGQQRVITTFGRGGSDLSATAFAEAIHSHIPVAGVYEFKADVPAVMTADPRIVEGAMPNTHMHYDELKALSGIGAKVIHAKAVGHVANIDVPLYIRNTQNPDLPGTTVDGNILPDDRPVKAVTYLDKLPWLHIEGEGMDQYGIAADVTGALKQKRIDIKIIVQSSEEAIDIALAPTDDLETMQEDINKALRPYLLSEDIDQIEVSRRVAALGIVGMGVEKPEVREQIFRGMRGSDKYPVDSAPNIMSGRKYEVSILIFNDDDKNAKNAVNAIHQEIFPEGA